MSIEDAKISAKNIFFKKYKNTFSLTLNLQLFCVRLKACVCLQTPLDVLLRVCPIEIEKIDHRFYQGIYQQIEVGRIKGRSNRNDQIFSNIYTHQPIAVIFLISTSIHHGGAWFRISVVFLK